MIKKLGTMSIFLWAGILLVGNVILSTSAPMWTIIGFNLLMAFIFFYSSKIFKPRE